MRVVIKGLPECLCVVAFCFFVGTLLDLSYYHFFGPGLWQPTIVCSCPMCDLGDVSDSKQCLVGFAIKNIGSRPLIVEEVKPSCAACVTVVGFPKEPIPPGNGSDIHVALITNGLSGAVAKTVAVLSNDPKTPALILSVHANIRKKTSSQAEDKHASPNRSRGGIVK